MSSLHFGRMAAITLGILAQPVLADSPVELEALTVTSDYDNESATGPVKGYRASRSASATKTDSAISDIPQAISVIPQSVLKDLGSNNVERALEYAGGVSRQNNFGA